MFIVIDGIDGSGKGTIIQAWKDYLAEQGNAIFDLRNYLKEKNEYPPIEEARSYDFIFGCEPTYTGVGKVIREELIKKDSHYPTRAIAHAYSLDRLILYQKINIPLLASDKIIIQDRSFSTSLCYQSLGEDGLNFKELLDLPGNALALKHRPDHLIICDIDPDDALQRLAGRHDKQDNACFEKLDFMKKSSAQFKNPEYQKIFTDQGTAIHYLPTGTNIDIMKDVAIKLFKSLI